MWEIGGVPIGCSSGIFEHFLSASGWKCHLIRSYPTSKFTRTWIARASEAPLRKILQIEEGLVTIQSALPPKTIAQKRKEKVVSLSAQRSIPSVNDRRPHLQGAWQERIRASAEEGSASANRPPASATSSDAQLPSLIADAISKAMSPLLSRITAIEKTLTSSEDVEAISETSEGQFAIPRARRSRSQDLLRSPPRSRQRR